MKIYSMTATFGKLEHATLTLEPGLNILNAPNEWGKSTWCAFLVAMLYGLETRTHTTKTALSEKERYSPWSGSPMTGRIDLCWEGRDITIERRTKGRSIFGDFRAYETATGLAVPELTGVNCGQTLLGVERSVFTRAGFLRLTDLPVTQDESLRRRLNALVTTGDESGAGDTLAQKLKDLKNRCRWGRTGLIPQVESLRGELIQSLSELQELKSQSQRIQERQKELEAHLVRLENHKAALQYEAAKTDAGLVAQAESARDHAAGDLARLEAQCASLPPRDEAEQAVQSLRELLQQQQSLQMEAQMLPSIPLPPEPPAPFRELDPETSLSLAEADQKKYRALVKDRKPSPLLWIPGLLILLAGAGAAAARYGYVLLGIGGILLLLGLTVYCLASRKHALNSRECEALVKRYGSQDPEMWTALALEYRDAQVFYHQEQKRCQTIRGDLDSRLAAWEQKAAQAAQGRTPSECLKSWEDILHAWDACADARREHQRLSSHAQALRTMAKTASPPRFPDTLAYSEAETARLLSDTALEQRQLQLKLGQCLGRMDKLGQEEDMTSQLAALDRRLAQLEDTYAALTIAQDALAAATAELQRRFAPRISARTQALFARLTGNRYGRLTLGEDLSLQVGTGDEDTLRSALWRSDGTVDQLYLALRLAVAGELTPNAPLILDDALVRFDDARLSSAIEILREEAKAKQVILFTCQKREQNA